jgi:hypothetical protein
MVYRLTLMNLGANVTIQELAEINIACADSSASD